MLEKMLSEELFFNYAGVCSEVLVEMGSMEKEKYDALKKFMKEGKAPTREFLEESYPAAIRRIKRLAEKMGIADYWDIRVIQEYWYNEHNKVIDSKDGNYARFPEVFCEYCKVHVAEVQKILPNNFVLVKYGKIQRPVFVKKYLGELSVGEKVRIHQSEAIEKVED